MIRLLLTFGLQGNEVALPWGFPHESKSFFLVTLTPNHQNNIDIDKDAVYSRVERKRLCRFSSTAPSNLEASMPSKHGSFLSEELFNPNT
mmetsp:Transcript_14494/g.16444  ORF Transcript_14494/g.16444 Transcript_14494/m.16444 type:complete len:90 (+) Transcript_14494:725-994(+)